MDKVGGPLQDLLARLRLERPMVGWHAVTLWPTVVGERIATRAQAVSFRDGELLIAVDGPGWMSELHFLKRRLIADLNAKLEEPVIRDLRFVLGRPPSPTENKHA